MHQPWTEPSEANAGALNRHGGLAAPTHRDGPGNPPKLTIHLFGGMSIRDRWLMDHLPRSRKTRALVAILTLNAPKPVAREQLTSFLWSRREKQQARASLRQAVHELRVANGHVWHSILVAERHHLSFDLREVQVDALAATDPSAAQTELLTLFQGGFLEDLDGLDPTLDRWLLRERLRLQAMACTAGEAILKELGAGEQAIAVAQSLLRIDYAHDGAWRALIRAHSAAGDLAAASFATRQWHEAMSLASGQAPPPDMSAFLGRIRNPARGRLIPAEPRDMHPSVNGGRPGPRLGILQMRTIGQNVDAALAAGLSEEIITAMSRFRWISCVSARSLAEMAGTRDGGHLYSPDIDLVLDGTIQAGSDRLRITVRLFDMRAGGKVIWAYCFDRNLTDTIADVIVLQDDVAAAIVAQVEPAVQIREAERAGLPDSRTASPRDLVLQAVAAIYRLERPSFLAAGAMLEAAIRAEPGHADALAWLAHWNYFLVDQGWAEAPDVTTARAGALAEAAVSSNPNDARSLTLAGHVRGFLMRRPAEAEVLHDRAISLNPNLAIAWCLAGLSRSYAGDQDGAISRMCEAIDLSPLDPHFFFFQAAIVTPLMLRGQHREAATAGRAAIELNPGFSSAFRGYLAALGKLGREREAADVLSRLLKLEPGFTVQDAMRRSPLNRSEDVACYADGLRRAGLPEG